MFDPKPLKNGEASETQLMFGVWNILDEAEPILKDRLKHCRQWANFRMMQAITPKIVKGLMATMEESKAKRLQMHLGNQELRVVPTTNTQPKPGYIYVEEDYVRDLMVMGMQNLCLVCEGGHQDRKGCRLRKILKDICMFELQESKAECLGQWLLSRYQD